MNPFSYLLSLSLSDFKKAFAKLLMVHHPDRGGDTRQMQFLNDIREAFVNGTVRTARARQNEKEAQPDYKGKKTPKAKADEWDAKLADAINKLLDVPNVHIYVLGTWLWVEGDTNPVKDLLKANGFKYQFKGGVSRWYFGQVFGPAKGYSRVPQHLIEARYGRREFDKEGGLVKK